MNGTTHATIGAAGGFIIASTSQADSMMTFLFIGAGAIAGLIPDMDIDGALSKKITFSHELVRSIAQFIGLLMIIYSFIDGVQEKKWLGMATGTGMIVLASFLTQKRMLTMTGIGVLAGGLSLQENWLILLGIYIIIASFLPHRSYTHSLAGLIYFGIMANQLQISMQVEGIFITCMIGYSSHLIADMKVLPFNKRGVKLFLPFSSKEL
ncbi:metal-dependent hydrolase [Metabacillus arenae]|uniref:Metal-dependent hydrolase n=1 Tax=Metabacillus arenae TaxID=2771434 RepID=A0A926NN92_9BACI|nr:metal-dependent hydrolase [Metabacillus arenae]MBD1381102.1 metal-dependent hydrolase [Metabacillus arenae]